MGIRGEDDHVRRGQEHAESLYNAQRLGRRGVRVVIRCLGHGRNFLFRYYIEDMRLLSWKNNTKSSIYLSFFIIEFHKFENG